MSDINGQLRDVARKKSGAIGSKPGGVGLRPIQLEVREWP